MVSEKLVVCCYKISQL